MGWRRFFGAPGRALVAGAALAVLGAAVGLAWQQLRSDPALTEPAPAGTPPRVDRPAPAFAQPLLSKPGSLSLARYAGKVVVVNFWASWCTACRSETSDLESLWRTYGQRGVQVVGVDYNDRRAAAIDFVRAHGMSYPSVFDPNGTVGDAYGIFGLPTTFIIGSDNRIHYVVHGKIQLVSFTTALESVWRTEGSEGSGR